MFPDDTSSTTVSALTAPAPYTHTDVHYGHPRAGTEKVRARQRAKFSKAINEWDQIDISTPFASHQWIEPGELIDEQRLVVLPRGDYFALCLDARIVSPQRIGRNKEWNAMAIVAAASCERRHGMEPYIQSDEDRRKTEAIERAKREQERREKERKEQERKEKERKERA